MVTEEKVRSYLGEYVRISLKTGVVQRIAEGLLGYNEPYFIIHEGKPKGNLPFRPERLKWIKLVVS